MEIEILLVQFGSMIPKHGLMGLASRKRHQVGSWGEAYRSVVLAE